ncbi:STOMATAL CLOSURE-RELATED ACTIN-BINDING PROTEIN 1 [Salix koriyanagi]|uniref:STOMATAL CLOSURE-RELATED ACTIN-BINDING PROTEIN 1 n=1 Tax=Salix koriyanagi TaxID=2511006 RepID=A0A9Q0PFY3_9ROSI|nr:STOMATAL CLOSURE-RELATED ACTIN-BINDING PROTEIN 1 [Salix koriyanagi]
MSPEIEENMEGEVIFPVSADVSFASDGFPKYKLGPDNQILEEPKEDNKGPSLKQLSDQHKRLSVRDLACKFDKNLTATAKLAEEVHELCHFLYMTLSIFFSFMHDTNP